MSALVAAAGARWAHLTGADVAFPAAGLRVVVAPGSRTCPPGWVGVVRLGGGALVTVPDTATAAAAQSLGAIAVEQLTDPDVVGAVLPVADVLGPARLAYLDPERPVTPAGAAPGTVQTLSVDDDRVAALLAADPDDADESGIAHADSPVFVLLESGRAVAASAYGVWPSAIAHVGVLVARGARGRRLAATVGAAATAHAVGAGLLPQWRARVPASIRTAAALGYTDLGAQLSVRLSDAGDD